MTKQLTYLNSAQQSNQKDHNIVLFVIVLLDLANTWGGVFCSIHEIQYGAKCRVIGCLSTKVNGTQACHQQKVEWSKYEFSHKPLYLYFPKGLYHVHMHCIHCSSYFLEMLPYVIRMISNVSRWLSNIFELSSKMWSE